MNKNFISFNEKKIYFTQVDDEFYIALKPICEALDVNYHRQRENLVTDNELSQLCAEQRVVASDGKIRKMICLPEKFVYGWIFSLRSDSEILKIYRLKCYEILYTHFKGMITEIAKLSKDKRNEFLEQNMIVKRLMNNEDFRRLIEIKNNRKSIAKKLKSVHDKLIQGPTLFEL